jgi:hypothetical protein
MATRDLDVDVLLKFVPKFYPSIFIYRVSLRTSRILQNKTTSCALHPWNIQINPDPIIQIASGNPKFGFWRLNLGGHQ